MVRGGSWNNDNDDNFRGGYRNNNDPDNRNDNNGFRCASTPDAGARQSTDGRGARSGVQAGSWRRGSEDGFRPRGRIARKGPEGW